MAAAGNQSTFGMPSLSLNGSSASPSLCNGTSGFTGPAAAKTAALLKDWRAMTQEMWDAPSPRVPEYNLSAPPPSSAPKNSGEHSVDLGQAAKKTDTLLAEWKSVCTQQEPSFALSWKEQLQHQISQQRSEALLAKMTSMEYGR